MLINVRIADSPPARQLAVDIRWMNRRDMPAVCDIESRSFEWPWAEDDFITALRNRNVIGMVAESGERVVGFFIYELHKFKLRILNFAVHPDFRFMGVGRAMVHKLVSKLSADRRSRITLEIRETNLDAQLFFRRMGFRAVSVLRDFYTLSSEDAYEFSYRYRARESA